MPLATTFSGRRHNEFLSLLAECVGWLYDMTGDYDLPFWVLGSVAFVSTTLFILVAASHFRTTRHQSIMVTEELHTAC